MGDFYTQKGYQMRSGQVVTGAMEDYLEMICREAGEAGGAVRVGTLAARLNVRPSSVSKMAGELRTLGLVTFEKYGLMRPTEEGLALGQYLLRRHGVLHRFFRWVNGTEDVLAQVEQAEHSITAETLGNLEQLMDRHGAP